MSFKSFKNISSLRTKQKVGTAVTPLPVNFTSSTLQISGQTGSSSYINGTYTTSRSSIYSSSYNDYLAFNGLNTFNTSNDAWVSGNGTYDTTTRICKSNVTTNLMNNTAIKGEWVGINLPYALNLSSYSILARQCDIKNGTNSGPTIWYIVGSNTGVDNSWVQLDYQNISFTFWSDKATPTIFNLSTTPPTSYEYFRIIVNAAAYNSFVGIQQFNLIN